MQCDEFEPRLNELLDERRRPSDDAQLGEHAAECAPCRRLLRSFEGVLGAVSSFPPLEDDDELAPRVLTLWRQDRRRRRLLSLAIPLGVVAAALLVVVLVRPWALPQDEGAIVQDDPNQESVVVPKGPDEPPNNRRRQEPSPPPAIVQHGRVSPEGPGVEARPRSLVIANRAGQLAGELVLLGAGVAPPYEKAPPPDPPEPELAAADPPIWIEQVRPLGDTMAAALSALRRTLPQLPDEPPSS